MVEFLFPLVGSVCVITIIYGVYRIAGLRTELRFLEQDKVKLEEETIILDQKCHTQEIELIELHNQLKNAQNKIDNFNEAKEQAFTSAKSALFDLGNNLSKKLLDEHKRENKEVKEHSEQEIRKNSQKFHEQFERISNIVSVLNKDIAESKNTTDLIKRSLLSPSGAGSLAEITLENMLKNLNLRKNVDFSLQQEFSSEQNNRLRPDAIIYLPHNNLMVIDAKASKFLVEIEQSNSELEQEKLTSGFIKTMYNHLRSLSSKEYAQCIKDSMTDTQNSAAHVITLMFVPSETAIDKICAIDPEFLEKAWAKNIYPVGPTGIMNMLSFAKFQITENLRNNNQQAIITEVEKLISATYTLTEHATKMGSNLSGMLNNYDKFAASFNRNFLSKARNIQKLGITNTSTKNNKSFEGLKRYMLVSTSSDILEVNEAEQQELPLMTNDTKSNEE